MDKDIIAQEINDEYLKGHIYYVRGTRVMVDTDLAKIYGYSTKDFNRQVKNNIEKFEQDFMFQLTDEECEILRCQKFHLKLGRSPIQPIRFHRTRYLYAHDRLERRACDKTKQGTYSHLQANERLHCR